MPPTEQGEREHIGRHKPMEPRCRHLHSEENCHLLANTRIPRRDLEKRARGDPRQRTVWATGASRDRAKILFIRGRCREHEAIQRQQNNPDHDW